MIQRIQSLYLLVAVILTSLLFFMPFAEIASDASIYQFNVHGIVLDGTVKQSGLIVALALAAIILLHLYAIASFKKRVFQKKIVFACMICLLGLSGLLVYLTYFSFSGAKVSLQTGFILPLVAIILDFLAIRGIDKDEADRKSVV